MPNPSGKNRVAPAVTGAALLGIWYAIRYATGLKAYVLPVPHEILAAAWHERATLLQAVAVTARGAVFGFLAAAVFGFGLALLLGWSRTLRAGIYPYVLIVQMTPVVIVAPIYVLWFGQGLLAIVAITFTICYFPIVANTTQGFASVDRGLAELFAMNGASRKDEMLHLRIPACLPYFLTGLRIAGTLAPIGAITGDFLAGSAQNGIGGLGFMAVVYASEVKGPELFAVGLIACLLGFGFVATVNWLHRRLLQSWHESARVGGP